MFELTVNYIFNQIEKIIKYQILGLGQGRVMKKCAKENSILLLNLFGILYEI